MSKRNKRMTAMRQRALEAFAEGRTDDLSPFSTTALWEVARVEHRKGNRHSLARVLVELFNRTDPNDGTGVPIELRIHLPGLVSETKPDTVSAVSDTPALSLEPSPPPRSDAELVGVLLDHGWTLKRVHEATGIHWTTVSKIGKGHRPIPEDRRAALVALVAECEREGVE